MLSSVYRTFVASFNRSDLLAKTLLEAMHDLYVLDCGWDVIAGMHIGSLAQNGATWLALSKDGEDPDTDSETGKSSWTRQWYPRNPCMMEEYDSVEELVEKV